MGFLEASILGIIQGIAEWIPISSEGLVVFLGANFFEGVTATELIRLALYLHLGTFLAALIYFREDVWRLTKEFIKYPKADDETKKVLNFYLTATLISGVVGLTLLKLIEGLEVWLDLTTKGILVALGILLLITGAVQLRRRGGGERTPEDLNLKDGILAGLAQGLSALPGLSRSGFTISTLLLRRLGDTYALKLSFIMSLPVVLFGNILLNTSQFALTPESFISLLLSFGLGLATIHFLLRIAERIQFGWFVALFGLLVLGSAFI